MSACLTHAVTALAAALACACSGAGPKERRTNAVALTEGVVANVDGTPIRLAEVEALAQRGHLSPAAALARLEAEELLAAEAERRGYTEASPVHEVAEQALVQALLAGDVESEVPSDAEIEAAYAKQSDRWNPPERRAASHVLAVLPKSATPAQDKAAHDFATEAVAALRQVPEPLDALARFQRAQIPGLELKYELLPPVARDGKFVREFSDAVFALRKPGDIADPVRTQFGWHVIVLREILPENHVPLADARAELTTELALQKRKTQFEALLRRLQSRTSVKYGADVKTALAKLEF